MIENRPRNCIGYVYLQLGLQKSDLYIDPGPMTQFLDIFSEVEDPEEAHAVAIVRDGNAPQGLEEEVVHMAIFDPTDKTKIFHRPYIGADIQHIPYQEIMHQYNTLNLPYRFKAILLKLRTNRASAE